MSYTETIEDERFCIRECERIKPGTLIISKHASYLVLEEPFVQTTPGTGGFPFEYRWMMNVWCLTRFQRETLFSGVRSSVPQAKVAFAETYFFKCGEVIVP